MYSKIKYPENKTFAFTILDDTDSANMSNIEPIYRYLHSIGMRTTKTVWPLGYDDHLNSPYMYSSSLENKDYRDFMVWLKGEGFEITWHGPRMESSKREDILHGLEIFKTAFSNYPSLHVNHAMNADNLYWGLSRFDSPVIKFLLKLLRYDKRSFGGDIKDSEYYWGDFADKCIKYCRSFSFSELDTLKFNPSFPYKDSNRDLVDYWFATADVDNILEFESRVTTKTVDKLVSKGGVCILSTHLAKGFCKGGQVRDSVKRMLDYIANKDGWFVPVSEILDWRISEGFGKDIGVNERFNMEFKWALEQAAGRLPNFKKKVEWWEY
jgi:hypothetical protein